MGVDVVIHEMRPNVGTFAHQTQHLAEMVCSNSFRSDDDENNAVGLLHWEMRAAGGIIMEMADAHALPAGGALAVDRDAFAQAVTARLLAHPRISVQRGEVTALPEQGQWGFRHRAADIRHIGAGDCGGNRRRSIGVFSTPSRPLSISTVSTCRKLGSSRAMTRAKPKKSARPI